MLYNLEAKTQFTEADFRRRFPNISFPETIETHNIIEYGYVVIERDPAPALGPGETLEPGDLRVEGEQVFQSWLVVPAPASVLLEERDRLMAWATVRIAPLQDAVDIDDATPADIALLKKWKQYRVALNRIQDQPGFPADVTWPVSPE